MLQNVVPTSCGPGTQGTVTTPQLNADYVDILNIRSQIIEIQRSFLRYVAHVFKNMQMQMPFFDCEHVEKKLKYTGSSSVFGPHTINSEWSKMNVEDKLEEQKMTTKRKQRWFGFSKCIFQLFLIFAMLLQTPCPVVAEKSKHYYMQSLCKNHFLQQLYRKIDGAVLWSQNERNLDCIITFQTQSILQRFMLRFEMLQLDCNDHLYVYDGAHAVSLPKHDISCRDTKQSFRSVLTRTNFVTLKYVTDNWGTDANGFKLVVTSVKESKHTCKDFKCKTREFCIHPDLLCDGINHCGDDSDESVKNLCQNETTSTIFGIDATWFVLIVVCVLLVLSTFVVGISICACRRQELNTPNNANTTSVQLHHGAESNGSSKYLHHYQVYEGTLTREHTQIPSQLTTSGNWHHPAGLLGYHRIPHNLLKMATKVRPIWYLASFAN